MKVIAYSAWARPETFTVKSTRAANRLKRWLRDRQLLVEIKTEREYALDAERKPNWENTAESFLCRD